MSTSQPAEQAQLAQPERLLNKEQFAAKLQVTQRTLDRWQQQSILPDGIRVTIGGTARYRETAADQWIAAGCPGADQ